MTLNFVQEIKQFISVDTTLYGDRTKWYGQNGSNFYRFQFN